MSFFCCYCCCCFNENGKTIFLIKQHSRFAMATHILASNKSTKQMPSPWLLMHCIHFCYSFVYTHQPSTHQTTQPPYKIAHCNAASVVVSASARSSLVKPTTLLLLLLQLFLWPRDLVSSFVNCNDVDDRAATRRRRRRCRLCWRAHDTLIWIAVCVCVFLSYKLYKIK